MVYHFQRKYKSRRDISILVVEKNTNPFKSEDTRHDIEGIASFLYGYGFSVDLLWSLSKWKFASFEDYHELITQHYEEEIKEASRRTDEFREPFERIAKQDLEKFRSRSKLLRRKPINSVEDLADYNFLIAHPDYDDCEKFLPKILETYQDKPIILPIGSIGAAFHEIHSKDFTIENVKKDYKYKSVYIVNTDFDAEMAVLTLIEHLLDEKEKTT